MTSESKRGVTIDDLEMPGASRGIATTAAGTCTCTCTCCS